MPRLQLFELEDQAWFPTAPRDLATDYLHFMETRFTLHRPAVALLAELLRTTSATSVVDLCSGGGGPIERVREDLDAEGLPVHFTLTDRYPNVPAFERAANASAGRISYAADPVDARRVPDELRGVRTLFNAFHHFAPRDAVAVLRNAAQARQPIGVFEMIPERSAAALMMMLTITPVMVAVATPFIRPFRWHRLMWTYVLPIVPLTCWWDGVVSLLRAYTVRELEQLATEVGVDGFSWRAGRVSIGSTPGKLTYLLGWPRHADS
jgi:hypothetical protein